MTQVDTPLNPGDGTQPRRLRSPFLKGQQLEFCARCGQRLAAAGCGECGWVPPAKTGLGTGVSRGLVAGSFALVLAVFGGLYMMSRINIHNWYPDHAKAKEHMRLAHVKYTEGNTEETFVECDQALYFSPRDAGMRLEFAQLLEKEGQTDQALEQVAVAMQLKPDDQKVLEENAYMYDKYMDDEVETLKRYDQVLKKHPQSKLALFWAARTCERTGDYRKGTDYYKRYIALDNQVDGAWCGLARIEQYQGKTGEAIKTLREGIEVDPNSAAMHYELGLLLADQNKKPEAIAELKKSIDLDPSTAEWTSEIISKLNSSKSGAFVMVPLQQIGDSFIANVVLNKKVRCKLIVDTGAETTVISTDMAKLLKLNMDEATPVPIASATGYSTAAQVTLDTLAVGQAKQSNVLVDVLDMPQSETNADGLLGMSFLKRYKFSLDASHQLLQLQLKE
jgi:clan AA aspartic protease (TIGR02281 family)